MTGRHAHTTDVKLQGAEKMLQQGFDLSQLDITANSDKDSFGPYTAQTFMQELGSLAGNSMHVRAIGVALVIALTVPLIWFEKSFVHF